MLNSSVATSFTAMSRTPLAAFTAISASSLRLCARARAARAASSRAPIGFTFGETDSFRAEMSACRRSRCGASSGTSAGIASLAASRLATFASAAFLSTVSTAGAKFGTSATIPSWPTPFGPWCTK